MELGDSDLDLDMESLLSEDLGAAFWPESGVATGQLATNQFFPQINIQAAAAGGSGLALPPPLPSSGQLQWAQPSSAMPQHAFGMGSSMFGMQPGLPMGGHSGGHLMQMPYYSETFHASGATRPDQT